MHIEGEGAADKLAGAVRKVYDSIKRTRRANPQPKFFGDKPLPERSSITLGLHRDIQSQGAQRRMIVVGGLPE